MPSYYDENRKSLGQIVSEGLLTNTNPYLRQLHPNDVVTDGDTVSGYRPIGFDTFESAQSDSNEKAKKLAAAGIPLPQQKELGLAGKDKFKEWIADNPNALLSRRGYDAFGRGLLQNDQLTEYMVQSGTAVPTDRYNEKMQSIYRATQEKLQSIDPARAKAMDIQRNYNIERQNPGILGSITNMPSALGSATQQLFAGIGDFALDAITTKNMPKGFLGNDGTGNSTWLDSASSAENADKNFGYDNRESNFRTGEAVSNFHRHKYGQSLSDALHVAPELLAESAPTIASYSVPVMGEAKAAVWLGKMANAAKLAKDGDAARMFYKVGNFARENTGGFALAVGSQTNQDIDEFTKNNGGIAPTGSRIAAMTANNIIQMGTDKFIDFSILKGTDASKIVDTMAAAAKVLPEQSLLQIGKKIATNTAKLAVTMGEEGAQEYYQQWAQILNQKLGTTKYGSLDNLLANKDVTDEALGAGLMGAGMGAGMHMASHAINNPVTDKVTGMLHYNQNSKDYTKEQRVDETKRARDVFSGLREGLTTGTMTASEAIKQLNDLDLNAVATTESTQAKNLRDILVAQVADNKTPKVYGSDNEAMLDIEHIAVGAKSLAPESADYKAIQAIAHNANISPETLAKTLKTYDGVESEATVESRGYLTTGLQLRTEQAKGEAADTEKIAKLTDRLDKFYQSTESTYNRLKSGYDTLIGSDKLRSIKVGDYTIHKTEAGIAAYKTIMAAKERTMKGILDQGKQANIKLISKPTVQQPYYKNKDGKKISVPIDDIKNVSAIIAPKSPNTNGLAAVNPVLAVNDNTNFVKNQLVGISVPRHNTKDPIVNATHIADFTNEESKGAMAQIRKHIDSAIKAGTKFKIHEPKGHSKALVRLVIEHLKANEYQYVNKEWVKAETLSKNKKPKAEKSDTVEPTDKEVKDLQVPTNKELLSKSSTKGKDKVDNQIVDISNIVTNRTEDSLNTEAITNKDTKTNSIVKSWIVAFSKLIPASFTEEMMAKSTKMKTLPAWINLKAKDDPARGLLFLEDGTINSKAIAAMALAGNEFIMAKAGDMNFMDTDTAKSILGSNKASFKNINKIKQLGIPAVVVIDSLGNSVLNYMGLSIGKDVPIEVASKLKAAIGQHTLMLMEAKGLVQITTPTTSEVGNMMNTKTYTLGTPGNEATVAFVKVPKKAFSIIATQTRETFTKMKEELATTGTLVTGPTATAPTPKEYKNTRARRNKITVVPDKAIDALNKLSGEKYTVVKSAVEWVRNNTEQAKILMGYKYNTNGELDKLSRRERESIEASNMAIAKEVEVMEDPTLDDGMYFDWFFSRNGRFMLDSNTINPQTGKKLHRWVYVSEGNTYNVVKGKESDEFYMAVAQAVGYDIDKMQIQKSVAKGKEVIALGSTELKKALNGDSIKDIKVDHLGAYLTMLDVVEKLENAKSGESVESKLTMEFDAKTSGFGLKIGQLGFDDGYQEKVGVYVGDRSDVTNISDQLDPTDPSDRILDVYQGSAAEMNTDDMKVTPKLQGVWDKLNKHIPKIMEDGKITSELRNLFKQPFMEFNYAAGLKTLIESFSTKIVEDILSDVTRNNGKGYQDLLTEIKSLTGLTNIPSSLIDKYSEDITYTTGVGTAKVNGNLQKLLVGLVNDTYGKQLEEHYKKEYQELIDANQVMNNAFIGMFKAYRQAYDAKIADIKGITAEQKVEIIRELQNVFPLIKGPLSDNINEGIPIYDSTRTHAKGEFGPAQVSYYGKEGKVQQKTAQAIIKEFEAATKAGAVVPIHYIDGAVMAATINNSKKGLLGVHDAEVISPNNATEATHNYNENWYNIQSSYSVIEAIAEALTRVVEKTKDASILRVQVQLLEGMSEMEDGEYDVNLIDLAHMTNTYAMRVSANRHEFFNQPMTVAHMAGPVGSAYTAQSKDIPIYNPTIDQDHKYSVKNISKNKVESESKDTSADIAEEYEIANYVEELFYGQLSETAQKIVEGC